MSLLAEISQGPRRPSKEKMATYGKRSDGTPKGAGYFGEIPHPHNPGTFSTELSIDVDFGGKKYLIPLIVPTLKKSEIDAVIAGQADDTIVGKAVEHAKKRLTEGKSPFADAGEFYPLPKE